MWRRIVRTAALTFCVVFALAATIAIASLQHEVSRNRAIARSFSSAAAWIDDFRQANGRLPDSGEYEAWAAAQPVHLYGVQSLYMLSSSSSEYYEEATEALGEPNASDGYVLACWTGEWNEYYASWARKSTLNDSPRFYGFILLLGTSMAVAAIGFWYVAHRCRPRTGSGGAPLVFPPPERRPWTQG